MFLKYSQVFIQGACFLVSAMWKTLEETLVHKHDQDFISPFRSAAT